MLVVFDECVRDKPNTATLDAAVATATEMQPLTTRDTYSEIVNHLIVETQTLLTVRRKEAAANDTPSSNTGTPHPKKRKTTPKAPTAAPTRKRAKAPP